MESVPRSSDLYGVDLDVFIAERDDLARRLREEGAEDQAADIARLRKPTTDAWALNQVARQHPELMEQLVATHDTLRAGDGASLRAASELRRQLIDRITEAAASVLTGAGRSAAGSTLDRVSRTLLAAAGDEATERALREGTLTRPVEISADWPAFSSSIGAEAAPAEEDPGWQEKVERLEERARQLEEVARGLRQEAKAARQALEEARHHSEEADRRARDAERETKAARDEAQAARRRKGRKP